MTISPLIFSITVVLFIKTNFVKNADPLIGLAHMVLNSYKFFYTVQFVLASAAVLQRFKLMNDHLRRSLWYKKDIKVFITSKNVTSLKLFSKLYLDLCDLIDIVNSAFTLHLIFVVISSAVSASI